jgi:putative NADH-flavin reductase
VSEISYGDYAMAMIDEAENAAHVKQRFTVVNKA